MTRFRGILAVALAASSLLVATARSQTVSHDIGQPVQPAGEGEKAPESSDPWADCPPERQCLSGDIVANEAKFCCSEGQRCVAYDATNGELGGICAPLDP